MPTEHIRSVQTEHGQTWLTLRIRSDAPEAEQSPIFYRRGPIKGDVELNLEHPTDIREVVLLIHGRIVLSYREQDVFLKVQQILFESISHQRARAAGHSFAHGLLPEHDTIVGTHTFPFSIELPETANVHQDGKEHGDERLPSSLVGPDWSELFNYELSVQVKKGSVLSIEDDYKTRFFYFPLKPSPSFLNKDQDKVLVKHSGDWETHDGIKFSGVVEGVGTVEIVSSLSVAKPLTYKPGTSVSLTITSQIHLPDSGAADLGHSIFNNHAPVVVLHHVVKSPFGVYNYTRGLLNFPPFSVAKWWKDTVEVEQVDGSGVRRTTFRGELAIPDDLQPQFSFRDFHLKYAVDVYPYDFPEFKADSSNRLLRLPVNIVPIDA